MKKSVISLVFGLVLVLAHPAFAYTRDHTTLSGSSSITSSGDMLGSAISWEKTYTGVLQSNTKVIADVFSNESGVGSKQEVLAATSNKYPLDVTANAGSSVKDGLTLGLLDVEKAWVSISNTTAGLASYLIKFTVTRDTSGGNSSFFLSYYGSVSAVSNVPVPAALPLFGLGMVALAGMRRRKMTV